MFLFVGLGNPESKYAGNRHNVGFMAIDEIARQLGVAKYASNFDGQFARTEIAGRRVFLLKPQTFMNKSGISVAKLRNFYKIPVENIFVFYDELDLESGKVKIKQAGGDGGHNGIKSIDAHIGKNYWRVRFGIDHPRSFGGNKDMVTSYVLSDFTNGERKEVDEKLTRLAENAELLVKGERELFLTKYYS
jgi:PTH1 family peptidyl-tRNA hydrolase